MVDKRVEELRNLLPKDAPFTIEGIQSVNWQPHPYTIDPMVLKPEAVMDETAIIGAEQDLGAHCMWHGDGITCALAYADHKHTKALIISLIRDTTYPELDKFLVLLGARGNAMGIADMVFAESQFKLE